MAKIEAPQKDSQLKEDLQSSRYLSANIKSITDGIKSTWLFDSHRPYGVGTTGRGEGNEEASVGVSKKARME